MKSITVRFQVPDKSRNQTNVTGWRQFPVTAFSKHWAERRSRRALQLSRAAAALASANCRAGLGAVAFALLAAIDRLIGECLARVGLGSRRNGEKAEEGPYFELKSREELRSEQGLPPRAVILPWAQADDDRILAMQKATSPTQPEQPPTIGDSESENQRGGRPK